MYRLRFVRRHMAVSAVCHRGLSRVCHTRTPHLLLFLTPCLCQTRPLLVQACSTMTRLAVQLFSTSLRGVQASTSCASTCMRLRLRHFATHREGPFPSLNTATPGAPSAQPLAGTSSVAGSARQRDSIGPFPLGVPTGAGAGKPDKPWKQLSASGKGP